MSRAREVSKISSTLSASVSTLNSEIQNFDAIAYSSASPSGAETGDIWVDTSTANPLIKAYDGTNWDTLGSLPLPLITEIIPENIIYSASAVMIINGQNFQSGATVKFIRNDDIEISSPLVVFNNSSFLTVNVPILSASAGPYDVKVINPDNSYHILNNSLNTGNTPVWSTSAGVIKTTYDSQRSTSASVSVQANDPDGQNITYSIVDGSVPTGMSFSSLTGILTGTPNAVANDTTYSFTVRASDGINYSDRSFSYIVKAPVITSFTSVGNTSWTAPFSGNIRALVVAGGGGGGAQVGGGGGAGGLVHNTSFAVTASQSYTVTVGAGGGGTTSTNSPGGSGGNSVFGSITAIGGSGGGSYGNNNGGLTTGGSGGGGGGGSGGSVTGANGTVGQGNAGGNGLTSTWAGGGGGGAGGPGSAASSANNGTGGNGGAGLANDITGSTVYYAGGGGGCSNSDTSVLSSGGIGGGAGGWSTNYRPGTVNATANTGGGGGGVRDYPSSNGPAGNGGSGIVIIRY